MAARNYEVELITRVEPETQEKETKSVNVNAEDFRVFGNSVVFYKYLNGEKTNTRLFRIDDVHSIQLSEKS